MKLKPSVFAIAIAAILPSLVNAEPVKPLKALLVIGGCCHDYAVQKDLLKAGIEARANIEIDVCYSPAKNTTPDFECYKKEDWASGYDVIIHDECAAGIKEPGIVNRILKPHREGLPGVNLHCAMHSFRTAKNLREPQEKGSNGALWFEYLGLQSSGHGPKLPIEITYTESGSPITKGFENWTTQKEELYNNIHVYEDAQILATGKQKNQEAVVAWTFEYGPKKAKVFSTALGHFNETVSNDHYLDFVTRGLLWSVGKLGDDGNPVDGYGPVTK